MTFLSSAFLIGLGAVTVPVILHLIHRQRYPARVFTTLRFFDATIKHNVIQRRLIDRLLLALRVLALAALMLGLARPFWPVGLGEKRMSVVVVLDNSPSMGRVRDGKALFEIARDAARQLTDGLGNSDRTALLLTAPAPIENYTSDLLELKSALMLRAGQPTGLLVEGRPDLSFPGLTTDAQELIAILDRVPAGTPAAMVTYGDDSPGTLQEGAHRVRNDLDRSRLSSQAGNVQGALRRAASLLRNSGDGDRALVVLSDLQATEWSTASNDGLEHVAVHVAQLEPAVAQGPNLAMVDCQAAEREAGLGETLLGTATIRNYGSQESGPAKMTVTAGLRARPIEVRVPAIPAGSTAGVAFTIPVMTRERNLLCSAQVAGVGDPLAYDDVRHFQIGVRPPVMALCVNGTPSVRAADQATFFVMSALAVQASSGTSSLVDARLCELEALKEQELYPYGVLLLAGVDRLDKDLRLRIRRFVEDGRGLLIFPGADAKAEEYNGWGFLPATVEEVRTGDFAYVRSLSERAPAVAGLGARLGTGLLALTAETWQLLEPKAGASVLARFSNGHPALVEAKLGKGRVILAATGCHAGLSDWPLRPAFPILLRSLVRSLGSPASPAALLPDRTVGQGAARAVPAALAGGTPATFRITEEKGQNVYEARPWFRSSSSLVLPVAHEPGQHLLSVQPEAASGLLGEPGIGANLVPISVNHAASESALAPLPLAAVPGLFKGAQVEVRPLVDDATAIVGELRSGRDLWRLLLLLALIALVTESLVGWRWASQSAD